MMASVSGSRDDVASSRRRMGLFSTVGDVSEYVPNKLEDFLLKIARDRERSWSWPVDSGGMEVIGKSRRFSWLEVPRPEKCCHSCVLSSAVTRDSSGRDPDGSRLKRRLAL